jgi:hypothetical protein
MAKLRAKNDLGTTEHPTAHYLTVKVLEGPCWGLRAHQVIFANYTPIFANHTPSFGKLYNKLILSSLFGCVVFHLDFSDAE